MRSSGWRCLDLLHLGLQLLHLAHRLVGLVRQREEQELDDDGDDENGEAEIADIGLDEFEQPEERLGQEPEPAPVDHQVEVVELEFLADGVDDLHHLGAGEETVLIGADAARGDGDGGLAQIVGLVNVGAVLRHMLEAGSDVVRLDRGSERRPSIYR